MLKHKIIKDKHLKQNFWLKLKQNKSFKSCLYINKQKNNNESKAVYLMLKNQRFFWFAVLLFKNYDLIV